jgi:pimeloyl-ACP methyl ester carboxylesterase
MAVGIACTLLASACTDDAEEPARPTTTTGPLFDATFEEGPCPVETESPLPDRVRCGTVTVPERHAEPEGASIELAVAVIEPEEAAGAAADPLLLLQGGPGGGFVDALPFLVEDPIVDDRAMVLLDPRGTGHSEPWLGCPELQDIEADLLGLDPHEPEARAMRHEAVVACRDRLVEDGVDLAAYSYTEVAADIAVLREALGYDAWNLYGISNGGRMALEVVRRHPSGVRSLVLDATASPQGSLYGELWSYGAAAFERLFEGCERDDRCRGAYPDLQQQAYDLLRRLATEPAIVEVESAGAPVTVRIDDDVAAEALRAAMYDHALLPLLPRYIAGLAAGEGFQEVGTLIAAGAHEPDRFSDGMRMSVQCQEEVAFLDEDHFDRVADRLPEELRPVAEDPEWPDECEVWDVGRADASINEPVESDIPVLLLVGEYDPVHPAATSKEAAEGFESGSLLEVPGLGHGTVRVHGCPRALARAFLRDPASPVDGSCLEEMPAPQWLLP